MQKWHIHSAIGRGRPVLYKPRSAIVSSRHYLHTTSPRAQEDSKNVIVEESSKPLFGRAKRLQEATSSIENLYQRSAARDSSTPGHSKTSFTSAPLRVSQSDQPAVQASRHVRGVPLSRDVIEGTQRAQSSDGGRFTMGSGRRQPFPRAGMSAGREGAQPVVDARSLGARPEGALGSSLMRNVRIDAPPVETRGPSERLIFQPRNSQGNNGAQSRPLEDMNGFQQRSPRGENGFQQRTPREESARFTRTQRADNAGQAYQKGFPRGPTGFQARTPRGEGQPGRSRGGRSRASQDSEDSEPRRRKRGAQGGFNRDKRGGPDQEIWTEEEQQYLKEKAERKSPKSLEYEPVEFSRETFTGMGPATASNEWGMSEMLGERLLLAKKYLDREFIQWDSKEQKADVMAVVEKLKDIRGAKPTNGVEEKAEEATSVSAAGDQQAQALMQKLFGGSYENFKRPQEKDVVGHVKRYVHRNDSYYPADEKSLLEKVRSILPVEQAPMIARDRKKDVKA